MKIAGLDISINSPGKCIMELDDDLNLISLKLYGYIKTKKWCLQEDNVHIECVGNDFTSKNMMERINMAIDILSKDMDDVRFIGMEGYSYGSKSNSTFQIGEVTGNLKQHFYNQGKGILIYPPSVVKQYATQKGNATKILMKAAFQEKFPELYPKCLEKLVPYESPQEDVIDAFWICEILRNHMKYQLGKPLSEEVINLLEYKSSNKVGSILDTEMYKKKTT